MGTSQAAAPAPGRKAEVLAFVNEYYALHGQSPSIREVARQIGISQTRVRQLLDKLQQELSITRTRGAQRAISVVGLAEEQIIAQLRALGWVVNTDVRTLNPPGVCAHEQLPLVAILRHIADPDPGGGDDDDDGQRAARAAALHAPGAGRAAATAAKGARQARPPKASRAGGAGARYRSAGRAA